MDYYEIIFSAKDNVERAKLVIDLIKKHKKDAKRMLELACGTGNYTVYWMKDFDVKATDISADMIKKAVVKCPKVKFEQVSMTEIDEPAVYDVVACMWESFRYLESFDEVDKTLANINRALKTSGLFVVDFHHFPPKTSELNFKQVEVNGKKVQERVEIITGKKGDEEFDFRKSFMTVDGKLIELTRSPLLRINENTMRSHLKANGFEVVHFQRRFVDDNEYSMLFITKKR